MGNILSEPDTPTRRAFHFSPSMEGDGFEVDNTRHDTVTTPGTFDEDPARLSKHATQPGSTIEVSGTYPLGIKRFDALEHSNTYMIKYWCGDPDAGFFQQVACSL